MIRNFILFLSVCAFYFTKINSIVISKNHQHKSCVTCKWFVPNSYRVDNGLCRMFKEKVKIGDKEREICNFAQHCRNERYVT